MLTDRALTKWLESSGGTYTLVGLAQYIMQNTSIADKEKLVTELHAGFPETVGHSVYETIEIKDISRIVCRVYRTLKKQFPQHMADVDFGQKDPIYNTVADNVNHPTHYTSGKYETIDVIQDKLTDEQFEGFCVGNVIKYVTRYKQKNGLEDLEKARWYLDKIISVKKGKENE
ncbi:MAG: DUF3310 domain-containing protein [Clostridia bacterium]|nr:DUF3310 domain-containing protein [Clostridia bacterium]